jgi:hypothetical protein
MTDKKQKPTRQNSIARTAANFEYSDLNILLVPQFGKLISHTPDGENVPRLGGIALNFSPQTIYVGIYRMFVPVVTVAPNFIQELGP